MKKLLLSFSFLLSLICAVSAQVPGQGMGVPSTPPGCALTGCTFTGPVFFPTGGSASYPRIRFSSTLSSGIYADSSGDLFFSTGNFLALNIGTNFATLFRNGSASGSTLQLSDTTSVSGTGKQIGGIQFLGQNTAAASIEYVACLGTSLDTTAGSETGYGTCNVWDNSIQNSHSVFHWDISNLYLASATGLARGIPGGTLAQLIDTNNNFFPKTTQFTTLFTVATLPPCNSAAEGTMAAVTDANGPTYNASVVGGGAVHIPVYCNGTNWTAH